MDMPSSESLALAKKMLLSEGIREEIETVDLLEKPSMDGFQYGGVSKNGTITFKNNSRPPLKLFIKYFPTNEFLNQLNHKYRFCVREAAFYNTLLTDMRSLWKEATGSDAELRGVFPLVYHADDEKIVMENLVEGGFEILKAATGERLNFEQAKETLRSLALLHGTSYVLVEKSGGAEGFKVKYDQALKGRLIYEIENAAEWKQFLDPTITQAIEFLKGCEVEGGVEAGETLGAYDGQVFELLCESTRRPGTFTQVLTHGDIHTFNMLFHTTSTAMKIIDLQTYLVDTPSYDLQFVLKLTVEGKVWRERKAELLDYYYAQFKDVVEKLGGKLGFTKDDLLSDFEKQSVVGMLQAVRWNILFAVLDKAPGDTEADVEGDWASKMKALFNKPKDKRDKLANELIAILSEFKAGQN